MKGKILIVLFSLILVFGVLIASCDNGDMPRNPDEDKDGNPVGNNTVLDFPPGGGDKTGALTTPPSFP